ncbi:sensor histidine kinase [Paenibacillus sp. KS-LC4]|uniref:sensor histidine kinase n=1 Tax=Paenibacillus sp. KS-LC4 TaxID=2979727 RepID=UPI0030CC6702
MSLNKFRTKARAVELLGRKQIRDDITALIELMKNSFDADADSLLVDFKLNQTSTPYLIIYDDGHGMTQQELLEKWLVIGTDSKKMNSKLKKSRKKKRTLMGEKGIGRLASAALGEQFLMFTKSMDENWNSLYLNWNIFENTDLFLDDISIPLLLNKPKEDLISNESINELLYMQKDNLKLSGWFEDESRVKEKYLILHEKITRQIDQFTSPRDHLENIIDFLDDLGQGTILVVKDLRQRWIDVFDFNMEDSDLISKSRRDRLGTFVDTFKSVDPEFEVLIYADNKPIEFSYDFDEELYEIYDLKIKGVIDKGKFIGSILSPSADETILAEINEQLCKGIPITNGISDPLNKDCGKFKLELCHFEMKKRNSSLSDDDRAKLEKRLEKAGGIKVFRDQVRVLPYGDAENDFLNIEMRRTKNAGDYLFSHRNMFGKILITSEENPELEDKSSREGLLENEQYYYFINTIQNLLVKIAFDYLTDNRVNSKKLRSTYLSRNNLEYDKKTMEEGMLKQEKSDGKKEFLRIKKEFLEKTNALKREMSKESSFTFIEMPVELKYSVLSERYGLLRQQFSMFNKESDERRNSYTVDINSRYIAYIEDELLEDVYLHNTRVDEYFSLLSEKVRISYEVLENQFKSKLDRWKKTVSDYLNKDFDKYVISTKQRIDFIRKMILGQLFELVGAIDEQLNKKKNSVESTVTIENVLMDCRGRLILIANTWHEELQKKLDNAEEKLNEILSIIPSELKQEANKLEEILIKIEEASNVEPRQILLNAIDNIEHVFNEEIKQIIEKLNKNFGGGSEDSKIIGALSERVAALERENEIYADLANMGMAAEIVNHEFNQLFTNVNDSIKNLKIGANQNQRYWIDQIESGFKAISARHTQLSPMYRSYNLKKRPISVYEIVSDMLTFFESRVKKNQIEVINEIDPEFMLSLSPSKVYPVFSNLIDNAIYWILNQDVKLILFRSDIFKNAIYIEDNGPGISSRMAQRIFDPFFTGRPQGRGLGLTIVKKVLDSQNHQINVIMSPESRRLKGACFEIVFNDADKVGTLI